MSKLRSEDKLESLERTLYRIREIRDIAAVEVMSDAIDDFASKAASVRDYLLQDINIKYGSKVRESEVGISKFRDVARSDKDIASFLAWYDTGEKSRMSNCFYRVVLEGNKGLRNISVHRRIVRPDSAKMTLHETVTLSEVVTVTKVNIHGETILYNFESPHEKTESPPKQAMTSPQSTTEWYFKACPGIEITDGFAEVLRLLRQFVSDAKLAFSL